MQNPPETLHFQLRQSSQLDHAANTAVYSVELGSTQLPVDVMHLAARILKADPAPNATDISFDDAGIKPDLISNPNFREFTRILDLAMPSWPALLVRESLLTPLLVLAPISNLSLCHHSRTDTWEVSVARRDLEARLNGLSANLGRAFTPEERTSMLWGLVEDLGE